MSLLLVKAIFIFKEISFLCLNLFKIFRLQLMMGLTCDLLITQFLVIIYEMPLWISLRVYWIYRRLTLSMIKHRTAIRRKTFLENFNTNPFDVCAYITSVHSKIGRKRNCTWFAHLKPQVNIPLFKWEVTRACCLFPVYNELASRSFPQRLL